MKEITTHVTLVAVNTVSEEEAENVCESNGLDSLQEVATKMEGDVQQLLRTRVFGDADKVPILDVNTEVKEDES